MNPTGVTLPVTVEFEDVDSYGIAHHARLVVYLERARLRFLAACGLSIRPDDCVPVMYSLQMHFRRPALLMDSLEVSAEVESVDDFRVTMAHRIRRGDDLLVRATCVIAFWDPVARAPAPVPAVFGVMAGSELEGGIAGSSGS